MHVGAAKNGRLDLLKINHHETSNFVFPWSVACCGSHMPLFECVVRSLANHRDTKILYPTLTQDTPIDMSPTDTTDLPKRILHYIYTKHLSKHVFVYFLCKLTVLSEAP